jgi:putative endonuclease
LTDERARTIAERARKRLFSRKSQRRADADKTPRRGAFGDNARQIFHRSPMPWFLYLIECADGSLYTGIATDVEARFTAHASGKGARYTRARKPVRVLASFELAGKSEALRAEYRVKQLTAQQKRALIAGERTLESLLPQTEASEEE